MNGKNVDEKLDVKSINTPLKIKYIGWDVDGTLYNAEDYKFEAAIHKTRQKMAHKRFGWDNTDIGYSDGYDEYKKMLDSDTFDMTMFLFNVEVMESVSKDGYFKKDNRLWRTFDKLSGYNHFVITDGPENHAKKVIGSLGLDVNMFDPMITFEDIVYKKLHAKATRSTSVFKYALEKLGCEPGEVLYVGDRPTDMTAKRVGMKTALTWQTKRTSKNADYLAPAVYNIPEIIKLVDGTLLPRKK